MDRDKELKRLINMKAMEAVLPLLMGVIEEGIPKELANELGANYGGKEEAVLKIGFLEGLQALQPIASKLRELIARDRVAKYAALRN